MRHLLALACAFSATLVFAAANTPWESTTWQDEPSWKTTHGETLVIVSEARSRVIYFGGLDQHSNLLSAPPSREPLVHGKPSPNWGGHRFWLGPQSRWGWPPPNDWEFSAATKAHVENEKLILEESHEDSAYPKIQREYSWEGNRLSCSALWRPEGRPYYGMHIIPIEAPATIQVALYKWEHVPHGLVGIRGDNPNVTDPIPAPSVSVEGNRVTLITGKATAKLGFYPQTLEVKRGDWTLLVHPGPNHGAVLESPDFGYLSQVWVGDAHYNFCELEQITAFLIAGEDGWCGTTIYFEARK